MMNNDGHKKGEQILTRAKDQLPYDGSKEFFSGSVQITPIFPADDKIPVSAAYVSFEPGVRTVWHTHPCGQKLIVVEGVGLTGEWDGPVQEFHKGDVISCPVGVKHWHGAAPDSPMTHIAVTGVKDGKAVDWLEPVSDEQYHSPRELKSGKQKIHHIKDQPSYPGPENIFTGEMKVQPIFSEDSAMPVSVGEGTFSPGARTAWHTHPCGQKLVVTEGIGLTGEWDGPVQEFHKGDVVSCPVGVKHWHGSAPDSPMTHISFTGVDDKGEFVKWLEHVSDEQYQKSNLS